MRILVTGATGYIGGRLVPKLLEAGHMVRVISRQPRYLEHLPWYGDVEVVRADVLEPATLPEALDGIDVAYYLIHSMSDEDENFAERDKRAAQNFGDAAKDAGAGRIIYLGGLGNEEAELSPHLRSRHETGEVLRASGVPVTEFRAAIIVGSGSVSFEMVRYLTERLPVMVTPRWVGTRCQPIAIRDVLAYLVDALEEPDSKGKIVQIGGADVLTYREMMKQYAEVRGLRRFMLPVPVLTPSLSSHWVNVITPIPSDIARPLIEGLSSEVIVTDDTARRLFSQIEPILYRRAVELAFDRIERHDVETVWSSAARDPADEDEFLKLDSTEGMLIERRQIVVDAPPATLFEVIEGIGGEHGWYYGEPLWHARGFLDKLVGGPGLRRGRRDPDRLRVGEPLDFWRVEALEPGTLLRLRAEMRVPGRAWLQFEVRPNKKRPDQSLLKQTAFFESRGLSGLAYWYGLLPVHMFIFSGMARNIGAAAERAERHDTKDRAA